MSQGACAMLVPQCPLTPLHNRIMSCAVSSPGSSLGEQRVHNEAFVSETDL